MFILSLDHTITLRYVLIVTLITTICIFYRNKYKDLNFYLKNKDLIRIMIALVVFVLYIFFHSIFFSLEPEWSLSESKSHILYPFIFLITGFLLGDFFSNSNYSSNIVLFNFLFHSLFIHIIYLDLFSLKIIFSEGILLTRYGGLMDSPVLASYITNTLIAFILGELIFRKRARKRILIMSDGVLYLCLIACLFSSIVENIRLGLIVLIFTCLLAIFLLIYRNKEYSKNKKIFISFVLIASIAIPSVHSFTTDKRWTNLFKVVPVAFDDSNRLWLTPDTPGPKFQSGKSVDMSINYSNYMRLAWIGQSFKYIYEDPLGVGFGRNAFGHAIELRHADYEKNRGRHSHSSVLELILGAGILGGLLWFIFVYVVFKTSFKEYLKNNNYFAIINLLLIFTFVLRSFVDANMRDHMFLQFMILLGVSISCMFYERKE